MTRATKRGLFRTAVVLMACWNLFLVWSVAWDVFSTSSRFDDDQFGIMLDCEKTRPKAGCRAEYEQAIAGYSRWTILREQCDPATLAMLELGPVLVMCTVWFLVWGVVATLRWVVRGFLIPPETRRGAISCRSFRIADCCRGLGAWLAVPRNLLTASICLLATSVSYYFVFSLPTANRARLQCERETAEAARLEIQAKEDALARVVDERKSAFRQCEIDAENSYLSYVRLNGREVQGKPSVYSASMAIWGEADKKKAQALAECHRQYDK